MTLLQQLHSEIVEYIAQHGFIGDITATYPHEAYVELVAQVCTEFGYAPVPSNCPQFQYYHPDGIATIVPCGDEYVTFSYSNGQILKCFDPFSLARQYKNEILNRCQHQWKSSFGLFKEYKDCTLCGARHEDLQTA